MDEEDKLLNLPEGWFYSDREQSDRLLQELKLELPPGHVLYHRNVKVIAHRDGTDDILCKHLEEDDRYTVTHLTWLGKEEFNESHPWVEVDGTFNDFITYEEKFK